MKLYFSIPDFYYNFNINSALLRLMDERPEMFYDNIVVDSVYGCFPSAVWNGGRTIFGAPDAKNVENTLAFFNERGVSCRYTFTNCLLEEKHLKDTWCNLLLDKANNGKNSVIVNSEVLEQYLRKNYPDLPIISSTTKCIRSIEEFNRECENGYQLSVLHYDFNNKFDKLEQIIHPELVEVVANEYCVADCRAREMHYKALSAAQLYYEKSEFGCVCPSKTYVDVMNRPHYISYLDMVEKYAPMGFNHFKIVGRTAMKPYVIESYIQYFVKPEYHIEARLKLTSSILK